VLIQHDLYHAGEINHLRSLRQHYSAVGKETGEMAHVERWNNTLRQRLACFVRKTLSFSKSSVMHEACQPLFLHRYNLEQAHLLA
jgi:insertion element IS1 protein InsB